MIAGQRLQDRLGGGTLSLVRQLPWQADTLRVNNPTDQILYIRYGGQDTPSPTNYDDLVPAFADRSIPVHTAMFALALGGTPSSLLTRAIVTYSRFDPPQLSAGYQQLGLAAAGATAGTVAANGTLGPFDLSSWGGLLLETQAVSQGWSQQGFAFYETSDDLLTWAVVAIIPIWPVLTVHAQLPRIGRYARVVWSGYGAPWDAAATFRLRARPTVAEVLATAISAPNQSEFTDSWLLPSGASVDIYVPGNLVSAIDCAFNIITGSGPITVTAFGAQEASTTLVNAMPLAGAVLTAGANTGAFRNVLAEPWGATRLHIANTGGNQSTGTVNLVPRFYGAAGADSLGQPGDLSTAPTLPGLLKYANADHDAIVANTAGFLSGSQALSQLITSTAGGAGVWTSTLGVVPAGSHIRLLVLTCLAAEAPIAVGFGTAAVAPASSLFQTNIAANTAPMVLPFPAGTGPLIDATHTTMWVFVSGAATVLVSVYYN